MLRFQEINAAVHNQLVELLSLDNVWHARMNVSSLPFHTGALVVSLEGKTSFNI